MVHFALLLAAFQLVAGVAVARAAGVAPWTRWSAAALIWLNGIVSLASAYAPPGVVVGFWFRVSQVADVPTALVIALLAVTLLPEGRGPARRTAEWGFVVAALVAALGALLLPDLPGSWFYAVFVAFGVPASYAFIIAVLARECILRQEWPAFWLLGAFLLRGADGAVRYSTSAGSLHVELAFFGLLVVVALSVAAVLFRRGIRAEMKLAVGVLALGGLLFGLLGRFAASREASFYEGLVTLFAGRPALMVLAFCAAGVVRPFFRGVSVALATYIASFWLLRTIGIFPSEGAIFEAAFCLAAAGSVTLAWWAYTQRGARLAPTRHVLVEGGEDWERLLAYLREIDPDASAGRKDVAEALGILPRNVQRVVDAANRAPGVAAGVELVRTDYARGPSNQLQYRYSLTPEGRRRAVSTLAVKAG